MSDAGAGRLIAIVGPSGAGKDTLIDLLRNHYRDHPRVGFVRRTITRPAAAGGEDHDPMTMDEFTAAEAAGMFCVTWRANGLAYGWPEQVRDRIAAGDVMIANGSRQALPAIRAALPQTLTVAIEVADDVLADRLRARGRENEAQIAARLARAAAQRLGPEALARPDMRAVDNSGDIATAAKALIAIVEETLDPATA